MDDLKKNPSYCFFTTILHRPATPIIRTGLNISLHLQIYILVDLKDMSRNIYKTSMYNRNLRVHLFGTLEYTFINALPQNIEVGKDKTISKNFNVRFITLLSFSPFSTLVAGGLEIS